MKSPLIKHLLIGLALVASWALAVHFTPTRTTEADEAPDFHLIVPRRFDGWVQDTAIVPVLPTPGQKTSLKTLYSQVVSRTYVNDSGQEMMVVLAFGGNQDNRLKVHRQEVCYSAQGFKIEHLTHHSVVVDGLNIPLTRLYAVRGTRREAVTYWFTIGNHVVVTRLRRLLTEIKYSATGEIPAGMLVRVSSLGPYDAATYRAHIRFTDDLLQNIEPRYRHWFIGSGV